MKALLQHRATRKKFLIITALILLLMIIIRIFVFPVFHPKIGEIPIFLKYIEDISDKIFTSLLVSLFIAMFLFYIEVPESEKKHEIIEPNRIKEIFDTTRLDSDFWYFSGGTGRFTRAVTLPEISKISQHRNEHRMMKILLLNPMEDHLCSAYASYRQSLRSSKNQWNANYTKNEILATICACIIHKNINPMLEISIFLKPNFSTLRIDLNKNSCIVTKEDKREPALLTSAGTFLYKTYKEEILQISKQCEELDMRIKVDDMVLGHLTADNIREICNRLHYSHKLDSTNFIDVAEILNKNENPYG